MVGFFWEGEKTRSRFNMLLLEYGEYFLEDKSVYLFPCPDQNIGQLYESCDALKAQGKLKICSRSLLFEPNDTYRPLVKFPFKNITGDLKPFDFPKSYEDAIGYDNVMQAFIFECENIQNMKAHNKIAPYESKSTSKKWLFLLPYGELGRVLSKISELRQINAAGRHASRELLINLVNLPKKVEFPLTDLQDFHEKLFVLEGNNIPSNSINAQAVSARHITPLTSCPGYVMVTDQRFYFKPAKINNAGEKLICIELFNLRRLYSKRYLLDQTGLELLMANGDSILVAFNSNDTRNAVVETLNHLAKNYLINESLENLTNRWVNGEISNFDYLMQLNYHGGRSLNDLTRYPIFPHVINDFVSSTLDLSNEEIYRDLTKPVGALNPKRLAYFKERMKSMPPANEEAGQEPPFLYGTHYSTPGYVLYYLVRVAPEHMLCLQNGKFDAADRMFISLESSYQSCLDNPTDVKELIPEFFTGTGAFLENRDRLELGQRQNQSWIDHVKLPKWANSASDFIQKHRKALESPYVSKNLHHWIDLIFGCNQRGENAMNCDNVFYHLTYEHNIEKLINGNSNDSSNNNNRSNSSNTNGGDNFTPPIKSFDDILSSSDNMNGQYSANIIPPRSPDTMSRVDRTSLETQMQEFGQTPRQLFTIEHPQRRVV